MHLELSMEYCIEHKRELSEEEKDILKHVLSGSALRPYADQVDSLKIVARCGCGKCPTVLFGQSFEDGPVSSGQDLIQYQGVNLDGEVVGVTVMEASGRLTELEASSFSGGDVWSWPPMHGLGVVNA